MFVQAAIILVVPEIDQPRQSLSLSKAETMLKSGLLRFGFLASLFIFAVNFEAAAQSYDDAQFGPVVRAYLGYLKNEQNVVDDRASRHEVSNAYYRRNSNRIRALRQMAMRIADESQNDYLPELEAVAADELGLIFENPPQAQSLRIGEVLQTTFRYLGVVRSGDLFYLFARLDPYEQSELSDKAMRDSNNAVNPSNPNPIGVKVNTRGRRVTDPR